MGQIFPCTAGQKRFSFRVLQIAQLNRLCSLSIIGISCRTSVTLSHFGGKAMRVAIVVLALVAAAAAQSEQRPIPEAGAYWPIPNAAVQPDKTRDFKAIYDATRPATKPEDVIPAVARAASLVNALSATGLPPQHRKLAIVFHDDALPAVLRDETYKEKYGIANPNLTLIHRLREAGVELFVCGQSLHSHQIDPAKVIDEVKVATSATIVSVTYQNRGYALLAF